MTDNKSPGSARIKLFASAIDDTLTGIHDGTQLFSAVWKSLEKGSRPFLCYNTGRMPDDAFRVIEEQGVPVPEYLICSLGTIIYDCAAEKVLREFETRSLKDWDIGLVESVLSSNPSVEKRAERFQGPFKSSWHFFNASPEQIHQIHEALKHEGMDVNIIYHYARDLDIIPKKADKANALAWLVRFLKLEPEEVVVAGHSSNDIAVMQIPGIRGIAVENSQSDLLRAVLNSDVYASNGACAFGVLEGLQHYGVISPDQVSAFEAKVKAEPRPDISAFFHSDHLEGLDEEQVDTIREAYKQAVSVVRKNITPMGFSACSAEDNELTGSEVNYLSVWSRDGAITAIGTMSLQDEDIRACQKATLTTLLKNMSPAGQFPSNVRLADGTPDYSGIGGICSVDSGLWVIIAVYEYLKAVPDKEFLSRYAGKLERAMEWLGAHDSNCDGLLEIPEAGDWTDLFGRSYNILYDEVLWYRANVCFARIMEMLRDFRKSADFYTRAKEIRMAILEKFWPTTSQSEFLKLNFADMQYTLGDAKYLIAAVSPFDFDWRCDVFGNVLAVLYNVLDTERAQKSFRFMWDSGVNEPFPVANLYPVVTAGDKSWKSYYLVNLLNLPHHYHNGGIWPFVGGHWVRFLHRIGLRQVACRELCRLALLNKAGRHFEWEFNEWAHGQTGRPMGKAYQAWSASEFISACHDLRMENA